MKLGQDMAAIVIGGSAGALDALSIILGGLPSSSPPVAVVLHQLPTGPSALVSVLQHRCELFVKEAEDKEPLVAGTVYVAPPNYHLLVERGGTVSLSADDPVCYSRPSIDVLFDSAAHAFGTSLVAVLLSGANEDGATGLARIQRAGGVVLVQSPESSAARAMPEAALARVQPDRVAAPAALGAFVRELATRGQLEASP